MLRLLLRYAMMVTPPLVGVLVLLHLGQGLTPPVSVKGAWSLQVAAPATSPACGVLNFGQAPATLTIVQSGPQLQLTLNDTGKTTLVGQISTSAITADGNAAAPQAGSVHLNAQTDPQPIPEHLTGQVSLTGCSTPLNLAFTAVRQKASGGQ